MISISSLIFLTLLTTGHFGRKLSLHIRVSFLTSLTSLTSLTRLTSLISLTSLKFVTSLKSLLVSHIKHLWLDWHKTQFEIECRSYGQSMTYFRFFSCGGQNNLQVVMLFLYVPCKKVTKKMGKKCSKSIMLWLCIRYCTDRLTLGHMRLFNQFLEVKLKHLEAW